MINDNSQSSLNATQDNYEINLAEIFSIIWKRKAFIIALTSVFAVGSVIYSLSLPDYYKSSGLLELSGGSDVVMSGQNSQLGGIASLAGINLKGMSSDKAMIAKATVDSRDFFKHISSFDGVLEGILATKEYNKRTKQIIYDNEIYSKENGWAQLNENGDQAVFSFLDAHNLFLSHVDLSLDFDTSLITLSVEHKSPEFAYFLTNLIISEVNNLERSRTIEESSRAREFLKTELEKTEVLDVRLSINRLIQSQLEREMLANVRENYLLSSLDTPFVPEKKSKPRRSLICIFGTFFGAFLAVIFILIREFIFSRKKLN